MHLHCSVSPGKHVSAPEVSSVGGTGVCLALPFHVASEELHASGPEAHTQQFCEPPGVQARVQHTLPQPPRSLLHCLQLRGFLSSPEVKEGLSITQITSGQASRRREDTCALPPGAPGSKMKGSGLWLAACSYCSPKLSINSKMQHRHCYSTGTSNGRGATGRDWGI